MPLKLVAPRQGKSPNWSIRGTYLKVHVDRSTGTDRKAVARQTLRNIERSIERGEYPARKPAPDAPTFLSAAVAYMKAGRQRRYVARLIERFGETPLSDIDQSAIDAAALALFPNPSTAPSTRNSGVYTPMSAILHHAGIKIVVKRPKGAKGRVVTDFLSPNDAFALIAEAESFDPELALLLKFLLYTGVRLGEALALRWADVQVDINTARIRQTKNGDPRQLLLRQDLTAALDAHRPPGEAYGRVFRFHQGGWLKDQLLRSKLAACGLTPPERVRVKGVRRRVPLHRLSWVNFHTFRHTWATWMRRYCGLDEIGLMATGNWRDARSARRYAHAVARDEWSKVEMLPSIEKKKA